MKWSSKNLLLGIILDLGFYLVVGTVEWILVKCCKGEDPIGSISLLTHMCKHADKAIGHMMLLKFSLAKEFVWILTSAGSFY